VGLPVLCEIFGLSFRDWTMLFGLLFLVPMIDLAVVFLGLKMLDVAFLDLKMLEVGSMVL